MEYYIGTISIFPYNFIPKDWHACDGTVLQINQYQALYSLLGPQFGGDGKTTFALPDLRGRALVGTGISPVSQATYTVGTKGGAETVALTNAQLPMHTHNFNVNTSAGTSAEPNDVLAKPTNIKAYAASTNPVTINSGSILPLVGPTPAPHTNLQPFLTLSFCIYMTGIYPQRP